MNEPTVTKLRQVSPYLVHPETKQIYGFYVVSVRWPNGRREVFDSMEQANAAIEGRKPDPQAIKAEAPNGYPLPA